MKINIKWLLIFLLIGTILFFALNPFYWLMASSAEKQPELTKAESYFISKWKSNCECEIERFFEFLDDKKELFNYSLSFKGTSKNILNNNDDDKITRIVLDSILNQKKEHLQEIGIYRRFTEKIDNTMSRARTKSSLYSYNKVKDSLINITKE